MLVNNDKGIFTVMTSNNVKDLPPELTRAGRLDAIWYFSLPNEEERQEILAVHFKKREQKVPEPIVREIAKETQGYTGAELEQIVKSAIKKAYVRKAKNIDNEFEITKKDLIESKKEVIPISKSSKEKIAALEQWAKGRALFANEKTGNSKKIELDNIDIDNFEF
jgi:SpoVK/Ycf46/Vps4 family AAA+-type ATPase